MAGTPGLALMNTLGVSLAAPGIGLRWRLLTVVEVLPQALENAPK